MATTRPTLWVMAVGVSRYADSELELHFADTDATAVVEALQRQRGGPLYRDVKTNVLLNEEATRGSILRALESFLGRAAPTDLGVIYLAGHGIYDPATDGYYFLPSTATRKNLMIEGLDMVEFNRQVQRLQRNIGSVVVILDTCYAGALTEGERNVRFGGDLASRLVPSEGLYILAAAKSGERSEESEELGHGAFTKSLLDGILGAAADPDGLITVLGLAGYAARTVPELTQGRQHPYYRILGGNPVLAIDMEGGNNVTLPPRSPIKRESARREQKRLAVMGFRDMRTDPEHSWMEEGLRQEFTTVMNIVTWLEVYAEPEVRLLAGDVTDPMAAARRAGMDMVATGAFAVHADKISISAHIKDVATMRHLASAKVEGHLDDFFDLRNRIVLKLLNALGSELPEAELARILRPSGSLALKKLLLEAEGLGADVADPSPTLAPEPRGWLWPIWNLVNPATTARADEDQTAALEALLEGYRTAFERKDLATLGGYYANFNPEQRAAMAQYLDLADGLRVEFHDIRVTVVGDRATVSFTRSDRFVDRDTRQKQEVTVRLTKTLAKTAEGWQIVPAGPN